MFSKLGGGGKPEEEKTVTAGTSVIEVLPSSGKTMKKVTVNHTPSQSKTVTPSTSQQIVSPDSGKLLSQVIVEAMEDVTPEVTAQIPIIAEIANKLGLSITTPIGTNKQKLHANNSNLLNIKNNANNKGLIFRKFDSDGNVTDALFNYDGMPLDLYYFDRTFTMQTKLTNLQLLEIIADSVGGSNQSNMETRYIKNLKLKVGSIASGCFYMFGESATSPKVWISSKCTTITAGTNGGPFQSTNTDTVIYVEHESKPRGWGTKWNYSDALTVKTTMWGVSEEQFDALL